MLRAVTPPPCVSTKRPVESSRRFFSLSSSELPQTKKGDLFAKRRIFFKHTSNFDICIQFHLAYLQKKSVLFALPEEKNAFAPFPFFLYLVYFNKYGYFFEFIIGDLPFLVPLYRAVSHI